MPVYQPQLHFPICENYLGFMVHLLLILIYLFLCYVYTFQNNILNNVSSLSFTFTVILSFFLVSSLTIWWYFLGIVSNRTFSNISTFVIIMFSFAILIYFFILVLILYTYFLVQMYSNLSLQFSSQVTHIHQFICYPFFVFSLCFPRMSVAVSVILYLVSIIFYLYFLFLLIFVPSVFQFFFFFK